MTWTRLPDDINDRDDLLGVSRSARLLHIEALVWCNRMLKDGRIPARMLRRISDSDDIAADVDELAKAGVWIADGDVWELDWSDQEPASEVLKRREYRAEVQQRYRDRKSAHARNDHSLCDPRHCKSFTGNETSNETSKKTPTRPVPTRPKGRDRDRQRWNRLRWRCAAPRHRGRHSAAVSARQNGRPLSTGWFSDLWRVRSPIPRRPIRVHPNDSRGQRWG